MNRLIKLLGYLKRTYPGEGWGAYVSRVRSRVYGGFKPRFDRILTSGHSQGAGMALFTARERRVLRVGMFGGANDYAPLGGGSIAVANWIRGPFATPKSRIFGFSHTLEMGHAGQLAVWAALKLRGRAGLGGRSGGAVRQVAPAGDLAGAALRAGRRVQPRGVPLVDGDRQRDAAQLAGSAGLRAGVAIHADAAGQVTSRRRPVSTS